MQILNSSRKLFKIKFLLLFWLLWVSSHFLVAQSRNNDFEILKNLEIFTEILKQLEIHYVDPLQPGQLMKKAIDAMLEELDPFTNYIPEADIEDFNLMTTGQYGGIGALIHQQGNYVVISEPYEGFPAHKSGLQAGDRILEIDGLSVIGKTSSEVSKILKGEPGTTIRLLISRPGNPSPLQVTIKRENIKIDNIQYYGVLDNQIGYVKLTGFTQGSAQEVKRAFNELNNKHELKGFILDLRGNGGGLLNEAVDIVNIFVDKGELVVSTKGKDPAKNRAYQTTNKAIDTDIPIVILVDRASASASEIVAGAIQDLDRGVIIGQRTYGKGLVQNVVPLVYKSQLKVTVAKYYIPSGRCIQAIDYSHRDEEGHAYKIPDSLISEFKTRAGRKVYDGGGIDPDIVFEPPKYSTITKALLEQYMIFDYATHFFQKNPTIPEPEQFIITDDIYADFKKFVLASNFDYTTESEQALKNLKETAQKENYLDRIAPEIELLEKNLLHNKAADLDIFRDEISELLRMEIASRYYFQKGKIRVLLTNDIETHEAIRILSTPQIYSSILSGTFKKASLNE